MLTLSLSLLLNYLLKSGTCKTTEIKTLPRGPVVWADLRRYILGIFLYGKPAGSDWVLCFSE